MDREIVALKQKVKRVEKENSDLRQQNAMFEHGFEAKMEERYVLLAKYKIVWIRLLCYFDDIIFSWNI